MADVPAVDQLLQTPKKISVDYDPDTVSAGTFTFIDEDHTLGNVLRYHLMRNPAVEFAAYNVPHPLENRMVMRIQTRDHSNVMHVLKRALRDTKDACEVVKTSFEKELKAAR